MVEPDVGHRGYAIDRRVREGRAARRESFDRDQDQGKLFLLVAIALPILSVTRARNIPIVFS